MMLEAEAMQPCLHQLGSELAVGGVDGEQTAADDTLGSTAFVDVDMCRLSAHHSLVRAAHGVDAEHVGTGAVEDEIYPGLRAELAAEEFFGAGAPLVVAVG